MTTTSISVRTRATAAVVSLLLLIGVQIMGAVPKAMAATPATISGTVVDSVSGLPLQDVSVSAGGSGSTTTSVSGSYTLSVPAGDYALTATLVGYAPKTTAQLTVADGAVVTGVNVTLQKYATVRGVVTNSVVGGVNGVHVDLFDATTSDPNPSRTVLTTGAGGFEITNVVPGSYKVSYDASGVQFMTRWYNGASTRDLANIVTIAPGASVDLSTTLVAASSVTGKVVNDLGTAVAGATVLLTQNGSLIAETTTGADGTYLFGSIGGADQYTVEVDASGYVTTFYGNVPNWVNAQHFSLPDSSSITLADIVLIRGGSISGTMDPAHVNFSYVTATVANVGSYSASVDTTDGTYSITGLPTGTYEVSFHANGFTVVTVPGVQVTAGTNTPGIDATLQPVGTGPGGFSCTVTGKVVNLAGHGLAGVTVASAGTRFTTTAADGSYSLQISSDDQHLMYVLDGYVTVINGAYCVDTSTIVRDDVQLSRIVTIKGSVATSDGPLAGATVFVYTAPNGQIVASATTAADGTYTITNLEEGNYAVSAFKNVVGQPSYPTVFYGGGASLSTAPYFAAPEGSTASGVNLLLYKAGSISGTVTLSDNTPAAGAQVSVWSKDFAKTVVAAPDGGFTVGGLPAGTYTLSAYITKWASVSQQVVLGEGVAASGKNITLGNGVAVSGIVSMAGTPVSYATVYLRTLDGQLDSVVANVNGEYVFRGVPQGTYTVGTDAASGTWWLGGVKTPAHAATFPVTTSPVDNVDLQVPTSHDVAVTVLLPGGLDPAVGGTLNVYDSYGDWVVTAGLSDLGVATVQLRPGTYTLSVSVDGYPVATASALVGDAAGTATVTLSAGADLTVLRSLASTAPALAVSVREVSTGVSTTGAGHFAGLAAGTYVVAYYPVGSDQSYCGPLTWVGGTSYLDATRFSLAALDVRALTVDANCAATTPTHKVTGTVVVPASVPLTAGRVTLSITDAAGSVDDHTRIDGSGAFTFTGLPAGTYTVSASDGDLALVDTSVQVQVTTDDVAVNVPMVVGGGIAGTVLDGFGHQVVATVELSGVGFGFSEYTPSGRFALSGLKAGDYTLHIVPAAPYTAVTLTPVRVALGATTDVGTVTVQLGGRITGHLPDLPNASTVTIDATDSSGQVLASTSASAGNDYALWQVPAGAAYVRFSGYGLVTTWWQGASSLATATFVQVTPNGAVSGIDPTLTLVVVPTTTVSGTVRGTDGPMGGVLVAAESTSGTVATATTAADGTYVLTVPANGTYTISASFCFGQQGEIGCYGQYVQASTVATIGTTPRTGVDLTFGAPSAPFTQTPVPTITGDAVVGSTLTADIGAWLPSPDLTQLQWLANGVPITGATGTALVLTPDLLGAQVAVQVTGSKAGYDTTVRTSAPTAAVQPGTLVTGTVAVSGTATVGSTLTADPGTWGPLPVTLSYQWLRGGAMITGATQAGYVVTTDDVAADLSVRVAGSKAGYADATVTSPAVTVGLLTMPTATLTVTGTPQVGNTLAASVTGWPTGTSITIHWLRDGTSVGTGSSYAVTPFDANALLTVSATGHLTGYNDATTYQLLGAVQPGAITGAVSVTGTGTVGTTVVAAATWTPSLVIDTTYAWQRGGVTVGTDASYVVAPDDYGQALAVVATSAAGVFGYTVTPATRPVPVLPGTISGTVSVNGVAAVGQTVSASSSWTPTGASVSYTWLRDGLPVGTGGTYRVVLGDAGHVISVRASATATGYVSAALTSSTVPVPLVAGTVTLPAATVGSAVTPTLSGWPDVTPTLSWSIDGRTATGATYTPLASDSGKTLMLVVTAAEAGFDSVSTTSTTVVQDATMGAGTVAITPSPTVGTASSAVLSGWAAGSSYAYSWRVEGVEMSTLATYTPSASDGGKQLTLTVTATKQGYGTATGGASASVALGTITGGAASISGTLAVGSTLTASSNGWSPVGVTVTYAWSRDGQPTGATGATYVLTSADAGHALSVAATANATGYAPSTVSSAPTGVVPGGAVTPGTVTVTGTPAVGSTLTAQPGIWTPAGTTFTYQWLRSGSAIAGQTGATYTVTLADVGAGLSVTVTGSLTGYASASATSAETAAVPQPAVVAGTVTITGTAAVGATLTANPGTWSPADATLSYQWLRNGVAITGATSATYVPVPPDLGLRLSVTVTGTKTGYTSATASSAQTTAVSQSAVTAGTVTINGTPYVWSTLTAQPGTWAPAGVRLSYQWLRDGGAISGANGQTYVASPTDLGHTLSVSVTGTRFGYVSATATSAPTAAIQQPRVTAGTVTITGSPYVTNTLTAQPGTWTPGGVRLSYQWLRDGSPIAGATDQTYTVATADLGHSLSVSVTGARFGYVAATAVSAPTAPVQQAHVVAGTVTVTGTATVGSRLTAHPGTWSPGNANLAYRWLRDGTAIAGATGTRYTVATADVGHALSVSVTGTRTGYIPATATSAATAVVPPAQVVAGTVTITGRAVQGSFLLAQTGSWSSGVALSYQWLRDGVPVTGARRWYYQVTSQDVGHVLTVAVTGTETDYLPATVTSSPTAVVR